MGEASEMTLTFRCPRGLESVLPKPIPAVQGLPDWFKALSQRAFNPSMGGQSYTVKKCPPFVDAMTYGFLIPLASDLEVRDGEFSWNFEAPEGVVSDYSDSSPIDFHDPSQIAGTPFFDEDQFIIKFNNFWTIEAPNGYSLLFTHPANRAELPITKLTGMDDCDAFYQNPVNFPARWHNPDFNGVLKKGTPIAQCFPVKRESWAARFEVFSSEDSLELAESRETILTGADVYRRQFRAPKR
jgi:hypothetical protein